MIEMSSILNWFYSSQKAIDVDKEQSLEDSFDSNL